MKIFPQKAQSYVDISYEDYIGKIVFLFGFSYLFVVEAFIILKDYKDQKIFVLKAVKYNKYYNNIMYFI